jgi:hypothetical protein
MEINYRRVSVVMERREREIKGKELWRGEYKV